MIDCHAHLASEAFQADLDRVLERAREAGLSAVVVVAEGVQDAERVLDLCAERPMLRACIGVHPEYADLEAAARVIALIRERREALVGIGEVGLDRWLAKEESARAVQREVLAAFAALSRETGLPLNVHSRSAGRHVIDLLEGEGAERVLLHAFDGRAVHALRGVERGYLFSVPPSIVRSRQKQKLVGRLPLEALALESDAPVLGPTREERNEPANVLVAARAIAEIQGRALEEVLDVTTRNARRLFRLDQSSPGGGPNRA